MTSSYVVTRVVASEIVKRQRERLHEADDWGHLLNGVRCGVYYSQIFSYSHDEGYASNIEDDITVLRKRRAGLFRKKVGREMGRIFRQAWRAIRVLTRTHRNDRASKVVKSSHTTRADVENPDSARRQ